MHTRLPSVLLLEDNRLDAELIQRELTRGAVDIDALHVTTGASFRDALSAGSFDAILADYNVPGLDGMAALDIAKELAPDTPFIFVSGAIGEERAMEALRRGATDCVIKDRISRLPSTVERALAERAGERLRREAERALRVSQERFLLASQATRDVIWDWSVDAQTVWVNEALESEWGYTLDPGAATIDWWREHIHPMDSDRVFNTLDAAISAGHSRWQLGFRFRHANGKYGHVHDRGVIVRDESGRPVRVIGAIENITARVEAERRLEQEQRISSLGHVAAVIAHEFNNVLMGIQPLADVVRRRSSDDPVRHKAAELITAAVARGRQITRDILRAANPGEPTFESIDLAAWLRNVIMEVSGILPADVALVVDVPEREVPVRCDPGQLHQVVTNLAANARDALRGGGELRIAMTIENGEVAITVADNGSGIADDVLPHVFDPLFTTKTSGTGLGLAVARQLVTKNGGSISATSSREEGTVFTLALPVQQSVIAAPAPAPPLPVPESAPRDEPARRSASGR
jgi:sigma-B regulation protein RsbU (phosphoserine phosphatase)